MNRHSTTCGLTLRYDGNSDSASGPETDQFEKTSADFVLVSLEQSMNQQVGPKVDLLESSLVPLLPLDGIRLPVIDEEGHPPFHEETRSGAPAEEFLRVGRVHCEIEVDEGDHPRSFERSVAE